MSDLAKFDLRGATIGNLAETVQGNQVAHLQSSSNSNPDAISQPKTDFLTLFYSYAHKDESLRDELNTHLKLLQRQRIITAWGKFQALPIAHGAGAEAVTTWSNPDEAFLAITKGIRKAAAEMQTKKSIEQNVEHL